MLSWAAPLAISKPEHFKHDENAELSFQIVYRRGNEADSYIAAKALTQSFTGASELSNNKLECSSGRNAIAPLTSPRNPKEKISSTQTWKMNQSFVVREINRIKTTKV